METNYAVAIAAALWIFAALAVLIRSVLRGRALADDLATRHPDPYEGWGRPRPGWFESLRRNLWFRFVMRREYLDLGDPPLVERFDAYRRAEIRSLVATLVWLAVVGGAVLWVQRAAGATRGGIG